MSSRSAGFAGAPSCSYSTPITRLGTKRRIAITTTGWRTGSYSPFRMTMATTRIMPFRCRKRSA